MLALEELTAVEEGQEVLDNVLTLGAVSDCPVVLVIARLVKTLFNAGCRHDVGLNRFLVGQLVKVEELLDGSEMGASPNPALYGCD